MADRTKVLIMGAAGRDFHNFNTYFRDRQEYEIVAFTATQIPYINDRKYPAELAGQYYPDGIPIHDESEMPELVKKVSAETADLPARRTLKDLTPAQRKRLAKLLGVKESDLEPGRPPKLGSAS